MKHNASILLLNACIKLLLSIYLGESLEVLPTNTTDERNISKKSSMLLLYDVDNVILKHVGPGKTYINPEIVPLLASMYNLRKSNDPRILLPRIFSHGCGTAAKLSESKLVKPRIFDPNQILDNNYYFHNFATKINDIGDAYLLNEVYYLKKYGQPETVHHPIDIFKIFFVDENELETGIPSIIPFNRVLERKSIYFDNITSGFNSQESLFFKKYIQKAKRTIGGRPFLLDSIPNGMDEMQGKAFLKKIFTKVSSFPKVWPFDLRSEELPFIKDLVKYRSYINGNIQFGTTILLLDDLVAHFNFGCVHEHFTEEYKVFIIVVRKFIPNGDQESLSREFQKSIPVPIGATPYSPFDIREVNVKMNKILQNFPNDTHPDIFYRGVRNEFVYDSPTYPKCGYDISKPFPFYFLVIIECDILHNLIKLFIDDRMAEEVTYLLNITSYIAVISGRKSCEYAFSMVKHLIASGFYQWSDKIIPLVMIKGRNTDDNGESSPPFSQYLKKNIKNSAQNFSQDRHIFMSKLYSRMPRSRTMVLRLDYHGDPSRIQYSDYTCFLNAPPNRSELINFPSKSTKYRQLLNLQSDSKLSKFFGVPPNGETKTITILKKLTTVFNKVEGVLESTMKASRNATDNATDNIPPLHTAEFDEYINPIDEGIDVEEHILTQIAPSKTSGHKHPTPAPPTTYPQVSYSFLSIFYTIVEALKDEFPKEYKFCVGPVN